MNLFAIAKDIAGVVGAIGAFRGKPKAPRNPYEAMMADAINKARNVVNSTDYAAQDAAVVDALYKDAIRQSIIAMRNYDAGAYASGQNPGALDTETGVAKSIITRNATRGAAQTAATLESTRNSRKLADQQSLAAMAGAGIPAGADQLNRNDAYAANQNAAILNVLNALSRQQKPPSPIDPGMSSPTAGVPFAPGINANYALALQKYIQGNYGAPSNITPYY